MRYIDAVGKKIRRLVDKVYVSDSELKDIRERNNPYGDPVEDDGLFSNSHKYRRR